MILKLLHIATDLYNQVAQISDADNLLFRVAWTSQSYLLVNVTQRTNLTLPISGHMSGSCHVVAARYVKM